LGDISDKVEENNAKNLAHSNGTSANEESQEIEKGALDSISCKSDENENSSPLITLDNGEAPVKKLNGLVEGTSFDQILDLGSVPDSNKSSSDHPPTMMAFEESIQQQTNNTADLLSWCHFEETQSWISEYPILKKPVRSKVVENINPRFEE